MNLVTPSQPITYRSPTEACRAVKSASIEALPEIAKSLTPSQLEYVLDFMKNSQKLEVLKNHSTHTFSAG
ncbi:MAG: hypothetical protein S4CHLAM20_11330 [Chlamydiia bacterium]|nr:hypothetical protein [Chlamydiia bacterium]